MGYFSNGTEGEMYREQWCDRCLHDHNETCPVWNAHLMLNYQEGDHKGSVLHLLIPRSKDGLGNERCRMFVDKGLLSNLALEQYASVPTE